MDIQELKASSRQHALALRAELQPAMLAARTLPLEQLARLIADLEEIRVVALARLVAPPPATRPDELVDIDEAARRLGVSKHYLYRHARKLQFSRHVGRKLVFSTVGIDHFIAARR